MRVVVDTNILVSGLLSSKGAPRSGTARKGARSPGQVRIRVKHRLENPGKVPLHLIEVQSGGYLGEDDIVRFEDLYQRT